MTRRLAWGAPQGLDIRDDEARRLERRGWKVSNLYDADRRIGWAPSPWQKVKAGDRLWVRENAKLRSVGPDEGHCSLNYSAGVTCSPEFSVRGQKNPYKATSETPSIHMPRWASRLTWVVESVKIERLLAISWKDAIAEGIQQPEPDSYTAGDGFARWPSPVAAFEELWVRLHGRESWDANPEVVAISGRVIKANIDSPEAAS